MRCGCWRHCTSAGTVVPVADTISGLFEATRAHVGFALRRAGEQVLANALHVAELARQYELSGGISFRGFIDALQQAADEGQAGEAPIVEEGSDGVRLMTVHKAKGLEFPIVILADMTAKLAPFEASRHIDRGRADCARFASAAGRPCDLLRQQALEQAREREEGVRIAYVAATRARDVLVVPAIGDQPYRRRLAEPARHARSIRPSMRAASPRSAAGCPPFKKDSVLKRPDEGVATSKTVAPGSHRLQFAGSHLLVGRVPPSPAPPRRTRGPHLKLSGGIRRRCSLAPNRRSACGGRS